MFFHHFKSLNHWRPSGPTGSTVETQGPLVADFFSLKRRTDMRYDIQCTNIYDLFRCSCLHTSGLMYILATLVAILDINLAWCHMVVCLEKWIEGWGVIQYMIHPGRLTWNLQINHLERKPSCLIVFHVNLQWCMYDMYMFHTDFQPVDNILQKSGGSAIWWGKYHLIYKLFF